MEWISITEKLPELEEEVLVYDNGEIWIAYRFEVSSVAWYFNPKEKGCGCCSSDLNPTHWMPLPSPPIQNPEDRLDNQTDSAP